MEVGAALILSTGLACSTALIIAGKPDMHSTIALVASLASAALYAGAILLTRAISELRVRSRRARRFREFGLEDAHSMLRQS